MAYFPASTCNSFEDFVDHNIIINLTLCKWSFFRFAFFSRSAEFWCIGGDWAGGASYGSAGCPSTCEGRFLLLQFKFLMINWVFRLGEQ